MANRAAWLKALSRLNVGADKEAAEPCPNCGRNQIRTRYIANPESRVGYALIWCDACLHGVSVSRVRAPDGAPIWPIEDPDPVAGVPVFKRDE